MQHEHSIEGALSAQSAQNNNLVSVLSVSRILQISKGMFPIKALSCRYSVSRLLSAPISLGTEPENEFLNRFNFVKFFSIPKFDEGVPESILLLRDKDFNGKLV